MKPPEYYRGREQTFLKHFFLERYLERVAYVTLSSWPEFTYVDGFSGPWRSDDEKFEDTSFIIAINKLRSVREGWLQRGRDPRIRCLFIEKDPHAFEQLKSAVESISDMEIEIRCGKFEDLVPEIVRFVGRSFSLVFIDPTGWTGFPLRTILPILQLRGEVIINIMIEHIRRFIDDPRPEIAASYDPLFGGTGWHEEVEALVLKGESRENAIVAVYLTKVRHAGEFLRVTSTPIRHPLAERTYFHLAYGTHHRKGLMEFREVEKKAANKEQAIRANAKLADRAEKSGMDDMFGSSGSEDGMLSLAGERAKRHVTARTMLTELLETRRRISYEEILDTLLETPLVWESDIKGWLKSMRSDGQIEIEGLGPRELTLKSGHGHIIVFKK